MSAGNGRKNCKNYASTAEDGTLSTGEFEDFTENKEGKSKSAEHIIGALSPLSNVRSDELKAQTVNLKEDLQNISKQMSEVEEKVLYLKHSLEGKRSTTVPLKPMLHGEMKY